LLKTAVAPIVTGSRWTVRVAMRIKNEK
jgi:hypothetical protein